MNESTFLETIFIYLKKEKLTNYPSPITFNINGISSYFYPDKNTHVFWYGNDFTGFAYEEFAAGMANISIYYNGTIYNEIELSRWTDLHKPRLENELIELIYHKALEIHQLFEKNKVMGSFEDYMFRIRPVMEWLRYFNSTKFFENPS